MGTRANILLIILHDLLTNSDFVVICAPHTPETEKMIRAEQLRLMKKAAYLVNVGRGVITMEII